MESISGLPAHPLFVHAPVVLLPLCTLLAVSAAVRPSLRRRYGWAMVVAAAVALVATQLAISSGNAFDEVLAGAADTDDHQQLALMTRNFALLFVLSATVTAAIDRFGHATGDGGGSTLAIWSIRASIAVATISSIMATIWVVRTGEEGARLVWDGVLTVGGL